MDSLDEAREAIAWFDRQLNQLESETRERIVRMTGLDGDPNVVSQQEWMKFNKNVAVIREQREHLVKAVTTITSMVSPLVVIKDA